MNYIFFGGQESKFAQIILDGLTKAHQPPLAAYRNAKENIDLEKLKSFEADFFLVAAFGKILKKEKSIAKRFMRRTRGKFSLASEKEKGS